MLCVSYCVWQLFGWLNRDKMYGHFSAIYGFRIAIDQEAVADISE